MTKMQRNFGTIYTPKGENRKNRQTPLEFWAMLLFLARATGHDIPVLEALPNGQQQKRSFSAGEISTYFEHVKQAEIRKKISRAYDNAQESTTAPAQDGRPLGHAITACQNHQPDDIAIKQVADFIKALSIRPILPHHRMSTDLAIAYIAYKTGSIEELNASALDNMLMCREFPYHFFLPPNWKDFCTAPPSGPS